MHINRDSYLEKLISKKENGLTKVITGIRRCGKSYLLFKIYRDYLLSIGVKDEQIIELALDEARNAKYRNPIELDNYIRELTKDESKMYYVFLDEIQKVEEIQNSYIEGKVSKVGFIDTLVGLMKLPNVDLYVTGSNSKMLSSDILTEFKDRGDEIRVNPLTFKEFYSAYNGDKNDAFQEYMTYGGMPLTVLKKTHADKSKYLKDLFTRTYISDVLERYKINNDKIILEDLMNYISSSTGSLINPTKLSNTFKSIKHVNVSPATISLYLDYLIDAFLISKVHRYDVTTKENLETPLKYYFVDVGLRNARLNFRQQDEGHMMENIIYNELLYRGFDVDIGVVEYNYKDKDKKSKRVQLEIDFIANKGSKRYYIQSALFIESEEKREQETRSLNRVNDSFRKIIVVKDNIIPWHDEKGILYLGIKQFLLEENAMDL